MDSSDHKTNWLNVLTMFYGGAVGDALGFPFEPRHGPPISDYHGRLEYRPSLITRRGMKYGVIGSVSDDTEMSLALLRSIVDNKGKYSRNKAILAYEDVVNMRTPGIGKNIKKLFAGAKTVGEFEKRYKSHFNPKTKSGINPEKSQSNGSLMRCAGLALTPGKNYRNVILDVNLTNPNDVNREAGVIYIKLLRELLFYKESMDPLDTAKTPEIKEAIHQARNGEVRDVMKVGKGWIVHTFYCAVFCLLNFDDYNNAVDWVIRLGGDTDTNAAVAGAMMGAKLGYTLLVGSTFETQLNVVIGADSSLGDLKRPRRYHPKEFRDLTYRLGEYNPNIELENDNYKFALGYYDEGYFPCWYLSYEEVGFVLNVIVDNSLVKIIGEIDENDNYRINRIEVEVVDAKALLSRIQSTPEVMEKEGLVPEASIRLDDIYFAYRFLARLMQALAELAVSELNPYVYFSDPYDPVLKELYGKRFLLLNI